MQVCPSLLIKKDRGRPLDLKARPKAYGEVTVATDVSGVELLQAVDNDDQDSDHSDDSACSVSDNDQQNDLMSINDDDDNESQLFGDDAESDDDDDEAEGSDVVSEDEDESSGFEAGDSDTDEDVEVKGDGNDEEDDDVSDHEEDGDQDYLSGDGNVETRSKLKDSAKKRKFTDFDGGIIAADTSLRALKKLAGAKVGDVLPESQDGILSNEDFQRIKELKVSFFGLFSKFNF